MPGALPGDDDVAWGVLARLLTLGSAISVDAPPTDFMFMGSTRSGPVVVYRFKHARTRRYLNIDRNGHTYRYVASASPGRCDYALLPDLPSALAHALSRGPATKSATIGRWSLSFDPKILSSGTTEH